ncbi:MAG: alpha/beta fold hydrolase [Planctomycetaceae bacterium]|nr:alpha/beta fold hydrolase [Planctomycetaceae bacterium]
MNCRNRLYRVTRFLVLAVLYPALLGAQPAALPESNPWDLQHLFTPPKYQWVDQSGPVHSLKYEGEVYHGKPTSVFAYYASPKTVGMETDRGKYPAIVLVHGGGGKAFSEWALLWAKRGYVAVAMDLAGRGAAAKRLVDGGPDQSHDAKFHTIDCPLEDQWTYHAVANVIRGHSLLRRLDEVDVSNTAVTGISWGGYLTCIVAGLDDRFQVAMPVYGCGFLKDNSAWVKSEFSKMTPPQIAKWHKLWDPSMYIGSTKMPVMFINGTNDFAYPMDSYAKTCALVTGEKNYSIQLAMRHGHIFGFAEFFVFIDQYCKGGTPMPTILKPTITDAKVSALVRTKTKLVSARLHYTTGSHALNKDRKWVTTDLTINGVRISGAAPPENVTVWYVDLQDARGVTVSSAPIVTTK